MKVCRYERVGRSGMNHAGTLWAGYSVAIVAVVSYAFWLLRRARTLGTSLDINEDAGFDEAGYDTAQTSAAQTQSDS